MFQCHYIVISFGKCFHPVFMVISIDDISFSHELLTRTNHLDQRVPTRFSSILWSMALQGGGKISGNRYMEYGVQVWSKIERALYRFSVESIITSIR